MKVIGRHHGAKVSKAAHAYETDDRECDGTGNENQRLNRVRVNDRSQTARHGIDSGGHDQNHGCLPKFPPGDTLENHAGGVKLHGNLGENVRDDGNARQIHSGLAVEAALEKFRHGEHIAAQIERHKHPAEDQQNEACQPFKMADR